MGNDCTDFFFGGRFRLKSFLMRKFVAFAFGFVFAVWGEKFGFFAFFAISFKSFFVKFVKIGCCFCSFFVKISYFFAKIVNFLKMEYQLKKGLTHHWIKGIVLRRYIFVNGRRRIFLGKKINLLIINWWSFESLEHVSLLWKNSQTHKLRKNRKSKTYSQFFM